MLVMRDLSHAYPFRPLGKTAADQTLERSITTQPLTIQPPPLPAMNGVAGSGSFVPQGAEFCIRQATIVELYSDWHKKFSRGREVKHNADFRATDNPPAHLRRAYSLLKKVVEIELAIRT